LLHVANGFVLAKDDLSADTARILKNVVYPTVLALTAMVGILFGAAVIRKHRVARASILIAWGLWAFRSLFVLRGQDRPMGARGPTGGGLEGSRLGADSAKPDSAHGS